MQQKIYKVGDYVRFINEKQEGKISEILPSGNIVVDIEDGFPIEVTPAEIVKVQDSGLERSRLTTAVNTATVSENQVAFPQPEQFRIKDEISLLIIPAHSKVTTGPVKLYLLNTLEVAVAFSFTSIHKKKYKGVAAGLVQSNELSFLQEIRREDLLDFEGYFFTGIIHSDKEHTAYPIIRQPVQIPLPDIQQRFPFLLSEYAFTQRIPLYTSAAILNEDQSALLEKLKSEFNAEKRISDSAKTGKPEKKAVSEQSYLRQFGLTGHDIDLHIEELTNDISGLSNAEIITIQLQHFRKELDKALLKKLRSIVFIHGVGNGRLKSEIRKELKDSGIRFRDADPSRYGLGATEVLF